MTLYADCCYDAGADSTRLWIDGRCEFLVRRKAVPTIVSAYPNPASDVLYVLTRNPTADASPTVLELFCAGGQRVRSACPTTDMKESITMIDVHELPPGRYTVRLSTETSQSVRTVVLLR